MFEIRYVECPKFVWICDYVHQETYIENVFK